MLSINFQTSTCMLDSSSTQSRTWTVGCKPPSPASALTWELEASILTLKALQHISNHMMLWPRNMLPVPSDLTLLCPMWKNPLPLLPLMLSPVFARWVSTCNGTQKKSTTSSVEPRRRNFMNGELPTQMWPI